MPQVYRRRSDYSHQRPSVEPRRRSTINTTQPQPPIPDSDDSIVLSDLVRAGETSRLRRRGAMRLDHPRSTLQPPLPPSDPLTSSSSPSQFPSSNPLQATATANPPSQPSLQPPSRSSSPPWAISDPTQDDADFVYGGTEWREWSNEDISQSSTTSLPLDDYSSPSASSFHPHNNDQPFMLFCGGEIKDIHLDFSSSSSSSSSKPFRPSPLPLTNHRGSSCSLSSPSHHRRSVKTTNGCGAVVHMRAFPQKPRAVWVGKEEATDVVVGLDASYFERAIVAKMMKSACGCIREGIGCAVCGNTLGTRYMPCQAASEGLFSGSSNPTPHHPPASRPIRPFGPRYWSGRPSASSSSTSSSSSSQYRHHAQTNPGSSSSPSPRSNFYVYTFFAAHVSSVPAYGGIESFANEGMRRLDGNTQLEQPSLPLLQQQQQQQQALLLQQQQQQQQQLIQRQRENMVMGRTTEDETWSTSRVGTRPAWYDYTFSNPSTASSLAGSSEQRERQRERERDRDRAMDQERENRQRGFRPAPIPMQYFPISSPPVVQTQTVSRRGLPALDVDVMTGRRRSGSGGGGGGSSSRRGNGGGGGRMVLDADGVLVESEEPGSPDKVGNEVMMWPGR